MIKEEQEHDDFWVPLDISNLTLKDNLKEYFFTNLDDTNIEIFIQNNKTDLTLICDRYNFIEKLQKFKNILKNHTDYKNIQMQNILYGEKSVIEITREEYTELEGINFNAIQDEIDALCQYLLLTIIDKIMGKPRHLQFVDWLSKMSDKEVYTKAELIDFQNKYMNENGLRHNFLKAFNYYISPKLRQRIIETFVIARIDLAKINETDYHQWNALTENEKYNRIIKYLYDEVRCKYTHTCTGNFLNYKKISTKKPTNRKLLINRIDPKDDNLLLILQDVVIELMNKRFLNEITDNKS